MRTTTNRTQHRKGHMRPSARIKTSAASLKWWVSAYVRCRGSIQDHVRILERIRKIQTASQLEVSNA